MNSLGWWTASIFFGLFGLCSLTAWVIFYACGKLPEWYAPKWKSRLAIGLIPVLVIAWFLVIAYGASHMFDPVPVPRRTPTVTVVVPQ